MNGLCVNITNIIFDHLDNKKDLVNCTLVEKRYTHIARKQIVIKFYSHLKKLSLYNNKLTSIPTEIALKRLTNLRGLYLDHNKLTSIPSEIGLLTNLQELYLHNNKLTSIPYCILELNCDISKDDHVGYKKIKRN